MIILRYLTKELVQTTFAVAAVLIIVIMSGDLIRYLAEAVSGKIDASVLFTIIFYRLPSFLELILPASFFISILLVYGRLYAEQEMTVLFSCGVSRLKILIYTVVAGVVIAGLSALNSLWLSPLGLQSAEIIKETQKNRSSLETLLPGRFQLLDNEQLVSYAETVEDKELKAVFLANVGVSRDESLFSIRAEKAKTEEIPRFQENYLVVEDGNRYVGRPGSSTYRVTQFDAFAQHIDQSLPVNFTFDKVNLRPTLSLLSSSTKKEQAALQWRFSIPLIVLVVMFLGVALSDTTPRRGRYVMLFPSILLYMVYIVTLNAARTAIEEGTLSPLVGLWSIHVGFFLIASVLFMLRGGGFSRFIGKRVQKTSV